MNSQNNSGLCLLSGYFDQQEQTALVEGIRAILRQAPLFQPVMPGTGRPFSVKMSNCGSLGWVADRRGYRYQASHPLTGQSWPPIPEMLLELWQNISSFPALPEACLINFYDPAAKMSLHQDKDEKTFKAPVVSVSLGDTCRFRIGGLQRNDPTRSFKLVSGDVLVMGGESRLAFHGVDRIYPQTSALLKKPGRINLTLRRVNKT